MRYYQWPFILIPTAALIVICSSQQSRADQMPEELPGNSTISPARSSPAEEQADTQPPAQPFTVTESDKLILQGVNFHAGTAEMIQASKPALAAVLKVLTENPHARVRIAGHTDSADSDVDNQRLSEQRAQVVKAALVQRGIDPARLETVGHGASRPLTHNRTPAGRAINRRVTLTIIDSHTDTRESQKARKPGQQAGELRGQNCERSPTALPSP